MRLVFKRNKKLFFFSQNSTQFYRTQINVSFFSYFSRLHRNTRFFFMSSINRTFRGKFIFSPHFLQFDKVQHCELLFVFFFCLSLKINREKHCIVWIGLDSWNNSKSLAATSPVGFLDRFNFKKTESFLKYFFSQRRPIFTNCAQKKKNLN